MGSAATAARLHPNGALRCWKHGGGQLGRGSGHKVREDCRHCLPFVVPFRKPDGKVVIDISTPSKQGADGYMESIVQTSSAEMIPARIAGHKSPGRNFDAD